MNTAADVFADRSKRALVAFLIEEENGNVSVASGVAVILGTRPFILTAAHNVRVHGKVPKLACGRPVEGIITMIRPDNGTVGRVWLPDGIVNEEYEPDVAVVEPTEKTLLPPRPYVESEIGFFDASRETGLAKNVFAGEQLTMTGFPAEVVEIADGLVVGPAAKTKNSLGFNVASLCVWSIPSTAPQQPEFKMQPKGGRGVNLFMSKTSQTSEGTSIETVSPDGMSGGPVVAHEGEGLLVALVRGKIDFEDGIAEWCEPAAEAIRLLLAHEDEDVRNAAARIVERYDSRHNDT